MKFRTIILQVDLDKFQKQASDALKFGEKQDA